MKNKVLLLAILLLTIVFMPLLATEKKSETDIGKTVYGYRIYDNDTPYDRGPAYFNINNPKDITLIYTDEAYKCSAAGAYVDGHMYSYIYGWDEGGMFMIPYGLYKTDLATGDTTRLSNYGEMTYLFADMTYDVTTSEMYYIGDSPEGSFFGKVNITNGELTQLFEIPARLMTLACNMYGQMYVITAEGNLASLDKKTGEMTVIGNTGIIPMLSQSMDFDRDTNILYWSMCNGMTTALLTVDTSSAKVTTIGALGNTSQITSLCIPFTPVSAKSPDVVTDVNIVPAVDGTLKATVSFKAPSRTLGGEPLASVSKIEVFRNDVSVKVINNPAPSSVQTFEDIATEKGKCVYKIVATNDEGNGMPAIINAFIGEDVPGAPSNVVLAKDGDKALLTWNVPTKGVNGGWIDVATLKYKVTRLPDNVEYDNVTGNSLSKEVEQYNLYSYKIQAITKAGEGETALSNEVRMGTPFNTPYKCGFKKEDEFNLWTVTDNNADDRTWIYDSNLMFAKYSASEVNAADDWLMSPPVELKAGVTYRIKFDVRESFADKTELLKVYLGEGNRVEDMTKELGNYEIKNIDFETRTITIVPEHSGIHHLGFYAHSDPDMWWICIKNVIVEQLFEKDLAAVNVIGPTLPISGKKYNYIVTVLNNGSLSQNDYKVELLDKEGNVIAEKTEVTAIRPNQTKEITVEYTPVSVDAMEMKGRVVFEQDEYTPNNETDFLQIDVQQAGDEWVIVGDGTVAGTAMPINFYAKTGTVQTIYTKEELKCKNGLIKGFAYAYNNASGAECEADIQIYLLNTDLTNLGDGWIQADQFTLVYNGKISVVEGESMLNITLDTPFEYDSSKNLCVMTNKPMTPDYVYGVDCAWKATTEGCSRVYSNDFIEFIFAPEQPGDLMNFIPNVMLKMNFPSDISEQKADGNNLYLNRNTGILTVSGEYDSLEIYDTKGQVLMNAAGKQEIDLSGAVNGIYIVKVRNADNVVHVYKIVK